MFITIGVVLVILAAIFTSILKPNRLFLIPGVALLASEMGPIALLLDYAGEILSPRCKKPRTVEKRHGDQAVVACRCTDLGRIDLFTPRNRPIWYTTVVDRNLGAN